MAQSAPNTNLPLFYNAIEPLNARDHGNMKVREALRMGAIGKSHAIPLSVDEFGLAQRHYPIVFSVGDNPVPVALMGLNEGVNTFLDEDGRARDASVYTPAYIRRYPFLLARITPRTATSCRCASTRPPMRSAIMKMARRCSRTASRAKRRRRFSSSASSSRPPASAPPPSSRI